MSPLVYIILVNYKTSDDTIECLESLREIYYDNYKVIIVENGSGDGSYEKLTKYIQRNNEIIINSKENLGFAGGNNLGTKKALNDGAEYILLLNNDTTVEKDFLNKLIDVYNNDGDKVGIVGCQINYYNDKSIINYGGGEIVWERFTTKFFHTDEQDSNSLELREITFVSGCAMMIKKEVIDKIGMLDHTYFMYYEDTDYCAKAIEAGFKLIFQPNSKIYHKISSSSGGDLSPFVLYWSTKNREKFKNKFKNKISKKDLICFNAFNFFTRCIRITQYLLKGETPKAKSIIKGYIDGKKEGDS